VDLDCYTQRMIVPATTENIRKAAECLCAGDVVAFPTETVYGLGADATNAEAVARIFEVKNRPRFDPLIVHVANEHAMGKIVTFVPEPARRLAARYWPGPLTLVLPRTELIPDIVTAGLASVAVRVPDHPVARALIEASRCSIAAPSANRFGRISPTTAEHVREQLGEQVEIILDGGPCRVGVESTIVSFVSEEPELLRPGRVTLEEVEETIGRVRIGAPSDRPLAPGQLARHYAPATPLTVIDTISQVDPEHRGSAALLLVQPQPAATPSGFAHVEVLSQDGRLTSAAANLFSALRRLDAAGYSGIYALAIAEVGLGRAIMDRLHRAQVSAGCEVRRARR
jgi:L-threonylcarbamoyladenylate synthase